MRFQPPQKKSPWFSQKEQLRLIMLCVALVLVLIAMQRVAEPRFWSWLIPPEEEHSDAGQLVIQMQGEESAGEKTDLSLELEPLLTDEQARSIADDYLGLKKSEIPLFNELLSTLKQTDPGLLQLNANREGAWQVWMAETNVWRGKLIEFEGTAKRIQPRSDTEGDSAEAFFDVWVLTPGSGSMPLHIVTSQLPQSLKPDTSLNKPVRVVGTIFKREGYAAEGGLRSTLLIAAAPLIEIPGQPVIAPPGRVMPILFITATVLVLFILFTLWKSFSSVLKAGADKAALPGLEGQPDFSGLTLLDMENQGELEQSVLHKMVPEEEVPDEDKPDS
ncbi:MAG: hypothetical protein R3C11_12600 [Planctomycetaceae bacterium]